MNKIATSVAAGLVALSPAVALAATQSASKQLDMNKALAQMAQELWSTDTNVRATDILASNYVNHQDNSNVAGMQSMDRDGFVAMLDTFHRAFTPTEVTIQSQIAEGDLVTTVWENTVTLSGAFMGVQPDGKNYTITGIQVDRIKDGRIAESWVNWDKFDLFQELGLVTQPKAPQT
ncbi:MAG: ester cyclase [Pseudomonadota bacterium]